MPKSVGPGGVIHRTQALIPPKQANTRGYFTSPRRKVLNLSQKRAKNPKNPFLGGGRPDTSASRLLLNTSHMTVSGMNFVGTLLEPAPVPLLGPQVKASFTCVFTRNGRLDMDFFLSLNSVILPMLSFKNLMSLLFPPPKELLRHREHSRLPKSTKKEKQRAPRFSFLGLVSAFWSTPDATTNLTG